MAGFARRKLGKAVRVIGVRRVKKLRREAKKSRAIAKAPFGFWREFGHVAAWHLRYWHTVRNAKMEFKARKTAKRALSLARRIEGNQKR